MGQPTITLNFAALGKNEYWFDANLDGIVDAEEKFTGKKGAPPRSTASKFVHDHPELFGTGMKYNIVVYPSLQAYFSDPVKSKFEKVLAADISALETSAEIPQAYAELLGDLKLIQTELGRTRFEKGKIQEGGVAAYNPFGSTMIYSNGSSDALLVHEMDHALTSHDRPVFFTYYLDYPQDNKVEIQYKGDDYYKVVQELFDTGVPCPTEASKRASLANEVRAYQTMCRYLLFKLEIKPEELDKISQMTSKDLSKFLDDNNKKLTKLCGSALNPAWVKNLLLHYFAKGGDSGDKHLDIFVKDYYEKIGVPAFVDNPDPQCKK